MATSTQSTVTPASTGPELLKDASKEKPESGDDAVKHLIRQGALDDPSTSYPDMKSIPPDVLKDYQAMAKRMGIVPAPELYKDETDTKHMAYGQTTDKGRKYIAVRQDVVNELTPRAMDNVLGHELGHFADGDYGEKKSALKALNLKMAQQSEIDADKAGAGPLGTNDPQGMVDALQQMQAIHDKKNPGDKANPPKGQDNHPPTEKRIEALHEEYGDAFKLKPHSGPSTQHAAKGKGLGN